LRFSICDCFREIENRKSKIGNIHMATKNKADIRRGVHSRIRKKVRGSAERPRLAVFRSLNHIYAQLIDDDSGKTLATASTTEKSLGGATGGNISAAQQVGKTIAERAIAAGVSSVVYDRGGYLYHGRVKALLEATREAGLNKDRSRREAKQGRQWQLRVNREFRRTD
jgi:large subunit ribosomal protein L18